MRVVGMEESAKFGSKRIACSTPPFRRFSLCAPGSRSSGSTRPADSDKDMSLPGGFFCRLLEHIVRISISMRELFVGATLVILFEEQNRPWRATLVDTDGTTNALTSFRRLVWIPISATSADNGLDDDASTLSGWTGWCYAFALWRKLHKCEVAQSGPVVES
jgi:hypothetical protein